MRETISNIWADINNNTNVSFLSLHKPVEVNLSDV